MLCCHKKSRSSAKSQENDQGRSYQVDLARLCIGRCRSCTGWAIWKHPLALSLWTWCQWCIWEIASHSLVQFERYTVGGELRKRPFGALCARNALACRGEAQKWTDLVDKALPTWPQSHNSGVFRLPAEPNRFCQPILLRNIGNRAMPFTA